MEEKLISSLFQCTVKDNLESYKEILNTPLSEVTDEYWRNVITLYNESNDINKKNIIEIFRQTTADAVSTILGVLDGNSILSDFDHEVKLKVDDSDIEDNLQDIFLELLEDEEQ